jgi:hypothetical protein
MIRLHLLGCFSGNSPAGGPAAILEETNLVSEPRVSLPASPIFSRGDEASTPDRELETRTHVRCRICRRWLQAITYTHLRFKHGIREPQSYKEEFSLSKITALEVRRKIAQQKILVDRIDLNYIRKNWGKRSLREITSYLGISASTVREHAHRMGLGRLVEIWNATKIIQSLRRAFRQGIPLHSGGARDTMRPLYKAALKRFGSWRNALVAAEISPEKVARRGPFESWSPDRIIREILALAKQGKERDFNHLETHHSKLYAAARNHFGSWRKALLAANLME